MTGWPALQPLRHQLASERLSRKKRVKQGKPDHAWKVQSEVCAETQNVGQKRIGRKEKPLHTGKHIRLYPVLRNAWDIYKKSYSRMLMGTLTPHVESPSIFLWLLYCNTGLCLPAVEEKNDSFPPLSTLKACLPHFIWLHMHEVNSFHTLLLQ